MAQAQQGDTVKVHYTGRLEDGAVFDSSANRDPLQFKVGEGEVIPGFDSAVVGMEPGEKKTTTIPAEDAYGPHRDELVLTVPRERLPENISASVGQQLQMQTTEGRVLKVTVAEVNEQAILLDANHPLAGKDLTFDIELVRIGEK